MFFTDNFGFLQCKIAETNFVKMNCFVLGRKKLFCKNNNSDDFGFSATLIVDSTMMAAKFQSTNKGIK